MNPDRWQQIERIYNAAVELEPPRREAWLAKVCAGDESLRNEVEALLQNSSEGGDFMKEPALEFAARALAEHKAQEPYPSLTGRTLLHYTIAEKIGEGGMGVVYRARDEHLNRDVAIKVLPPELVTDPERKKRFVQEARAASALSHPNIITVHDISSDGGLDFIAMEYVDGRTLDQLITGRGMRLTEALEYAVQIAAESREADIMLVEDFR
jgi:serine/threonine protein kinase